MTYSNIQIKIIEAMKSKDQITLNTLRLLRASLVNLAIEKKCKADDLLDMEVISVIRKEIKKCQDSIDGFELDNRQESIKNERESISVLISFLPRELSSLEIEKIVDESIQESNATTKKQMGIVMKLAQAKANGRISSKILSQAIQNKLN